MGYLGLNYRSKRQFIRLERLLMPVFSRQMRWVSSASCQITRKRNKSIRRSAYWRNKIPNPALCFSQITAFKQSAPHPMETKSLPHTHAALGVASPRGNGSTADHTPHMTTYTRSYFGAPFVAFAYLAGSSRTNTLESRCSGYGLRQKNIDD